MPHNTSSTASVNGAEINIAHLAVVDCARLASKEPGEIEKLVEAARSPGVFYLDCGSNKKYLANVQTMCAMADKYFDQPHEVKMKDYRESEDRGYKFGGLDSTFEIARDELVQKTLVLPAVFANDAEHFEQFTTMSHEIAHTMLAILSEELNIAFGESNRDDKPSDTGLKLATSPLRESLSDITENKHTDSGTLTIQFCEQWGTQLQMPDGKWAFVQARDGCALVNVADSLQRLSGGKLHSCLHRVTQPADGKEKRVFVLYFLRPEKGGCA
ncbi:uncharacterized protein LAJ45_07751 [Morchella importuna]|uniref:uncharacterized protein n=1 Tax=Morchella importuna TaxID=1174673 RepID=UPI001E8E2D06|nr:uncharacterized protein LAJ45_07751 [Morchella importuna]KAH8148298.1 hypothetical protein LAJ45_07751 [Morchella importuna]